MLRASSEIRASFSPIRQCPSRCASIIARTERMVSLNSECGPLNEQM